MGRITKLTLQNDSVCRRIENQYGDGITPKIAMAGYFFRHRSVEPLKTYHRALDLRKTIKLKLGFFDFSSHRNWLNSWPISKSSVRSVEKGGYVVSVATLSQQKL